MKASSPGSASSFLCPSLRVPTYQLGMTCSPLLISGVCEDWGQADGEALVTGTCYQNVTFGFKECGKGEGHPFRVQATSQMDGSWWVVVSCHGDLVWLSSCCVSFLGNMRETWSEEGMARC